MDLLKQYTDEIGQDLVIDDFNIKTAQMRLPARKHFWAARLINAKIKLNSLIKQEKNLRISLNKKIKEDSPVVFNNQHIENIINNNADFKNLQNQIEEHKIIIEYLDKVEKIFSTMHWEIRNIVELQKLEQL